MTNIVLILSNTNDIFALSYLKCGNSFVPKIKKAQKGKKMRPLTENNSTKITREYPCITRHFAERYFERILSEQIPNKFGRAIYNRIKTDMKSRMLDREKETLNLFSQSTKAIVPMARYNRMVVSKNTLITIY